MTLWSLSQSSPAATISPRPREMVLSCDCAEASPCATCPAELGRCLEINAMLPTARLETWLYCLIAAVSGQGFASWRVSWKGSGLSLLGLWLNLHSSPSTGSYHSDVSVPLITLFEIDFVV